MSWLVKDGYDEPRQRCACGSIWFEEIQICQVHAMDGKTWLGMTPKPLHDTEDFPWFRCLFCFQAYTRRGARAAERIPMPELP